MRRTGVLVLLATLAVPCQLMATTHRQDVQDMGREFVVSAGERTPWLTPIDLFTISVLPRVTCFDGPLRSYIDGEWISITRLLADTGPESICAAEIISGDCRMTGLDIPEPLETDTPFTTAYGLCVQFLDLLASTARTDTATQLGLENWR